MVADPGKLVADPGTVVADPVVADPEWSLIQQSLILVADPDPQSLIRHLFEARREARGERREARGEEL